MTTKTAILVLEDGTEFKGYSFGYEGSTSGEVVFNTAMTGYPESLTDPSYEGQILVTTYPLLGNYGVPPKGESRGVEQFFESERIHARAIIAQDYTDTPSHWQSARTLAQWLRDEQIPGIYGIDTRALTKHLREHGSMLGKIIVEGCSDPGLDDPNQRNLVAATSCKQVKEYEAENTDNAPTVVLVDCGTKNNIIRCLTRRGVNVIRVPWDYNFTTIPYDGLFISNGPGDPAMATATVENIRKAFALGKPICGICMGNQLMSIAAGARTYKLRYGHRSHNQPVRLAGTDTCFVTSQNHGFAVDDTTLPADWEPLFINMNDGTNEGIRHKSKPFFSAQFHPEASSGPRDTEFIFDEFTSLVKGADDIKILKNVNPDKNTEKKPSKVLILGSGALKIGEAGEFDYSGSQAIKALREEGVATVLINPNIATVQTSEGMADNVYFLPVTPDFVEKVIEKERPDGILLAFGGQTALNCGVELYKRGILERYGVAVLGTPVETIMATEDRQLFVDRLDQINVKTIRSEAVSTLDGAIAAANRVGYPVIVRAAYALGGLGSGFCDDEQQLRAIVEKALSFSPQVLVEKSLKGWKEIEYEVVRDRFDNCITVCNMENFDPLGIHTGESIVVAPSQTLSNDDYHMLRKLAIDIVRHLGIVGECNVQYAFDPQSMDYRVIEVNARLSRSSALASKATGYPLAFVAAKLALGHGLFDVKNSVTRDTTAFFEPALDYVVVKIPRWDLSKFHGVQREIGSSMKSVGEVMAIGRTFEEAIQKGLRMIGQGMIGFVGNDAINIDRGIDHALSEPTDRRIFVIAQAMMQGYSVEQIHHLTAIDRWFLNKLVNIIDTWNLLTNATDRLGAGFLSLIRIAKQQGFSDEQIAKALRDVSAKEIRALRKVTGIIPVIKQIDTLAAEHPAQTNYLYLTYNGSENDVTPEDDGNSVVVLGSGAYRIGSSVEFDWCSVNALLTAAKCGRRPVMINYNPETVSTDYDICNRLYFDELTFERVMDIIELERPYGTIISVGGQIPNNLAVKLADAGASILGTSAASIDRAEDRNKFSAMLDTLGIDQPRWRELTTIDDIRSFIDEVGYPVLVRPSYVLSGAAMNVCSNDTELREFLSLAAAVSKEHPVVVSEFIQQAKEIEMDAVASDGEIKAYAISEHIEFAGVHSGDATIQLPPQKLYVETVRRIKRISARIARELRITGPFNIQFLAKNNHIKVIECNLRASRSFPFVSKVLKVNFIDMATRAMLGQYVPVHNENIYDLDYVGIKASQFSFSRLQGADPVLGVDMSSTGEVGCLGADTSEALLKAMLAVGYTIPRHAVLLSTGTARQKIDTLEAARMLHRKGLTIYATGGTHQFLADNGIPSIRAYWPSQENAQPQAVELIRNHTVDLVVNIPRDLTPTELSNGRLIRRAAIDHNIPLLTNARLASAFIEAFTTLNPATDLAILPWSSYTN